MDSLNLSGRHTMKKNPDNLRIKAHAGFSLVDVMVGMVIALLGVIIMFQVFGVSESVKRTTTSGGDAIQNGASALFAMERSIKSAGYGIFASNNVSPLPSDPVTFPVLITPGAANESDTITITSRQGWDFGPFPPDPLTYGSAVPPALTIETISVDGAGNLVSSIGYNTPVYAHTTPPAVPDVILSEGIALMKAEYGTDTNGDGIADAWSPALPANPQNEKAIHFVVVARSAQPEPRDPVTHLCTATTAATARVPTWKDGTVLDMTGQPGLAAADDWMCYRYKTFENVVPLRNE
jgi:type IV pilus assembly protein PilW